MCSHSHSQRKRLLFGFGFFEFSIYTDPSLSRFTETLAPYPTQRKVANPTSRYYYYYNF